MAQHTITIVVDSMLDNATLNNITSRTIDSFTESVWTDDGRAWQVSVDSTAGFSEVYAWTPDGVPA